MASDEPETSNIVVIRLLDIFSTFYAFSCPIYKFGFVSKDAFEMWLLTCTVSCPSSRGVSKFAEDKIDLQCPYSAGSINNCDPQSLQKLTSSFSPVVWPSWR